MIKTLRNLLKQDKERFVVPRDVQDVIPIKAIYDDGIFQVGRDKFSKTYKFSDINYAVASREDKEAMFLEYSELLNSLDSGATTKITINNRRLNRANFEKTILLPLKGDVDDLLQSHTARTMLANSEFIVMLNQASTDRLELAKLLNISDTQLSYITNVDAGHGLIKVGSSLVPFANKFPKNTKLYKLMTTKPGEGA